ncbi:MAG: hypothetical protein AAGE52_03890 [Myxococcota bacterium]
MIAELAIGAGLVAAASFAYRALKPKRPETAAPTTKPPPDPAPLGLHVGDVLLHGDTELWLAGCFTLDEEGFVARLFRAPGNTRANWVLQLDEEGNDLALVNETDAVPEGAVPAELPVGGIRLTLRSKGSATITHEGSDLPPASDSGEFVMLGAAGGKILLVVDFAGAGRLAVEGTRYGRELFDVLPGGD